MRIGIDLLGADNKYNVLNFINKFYDNDIEIYAYGLKEDLDIIENESVKKILCTEEVLISDNSARVHRKKKDSSMIRMLEDLNSGLIDVSISAGSTGAYMASGLFILGRIEGVAKPALATLVPTVSEHKFLLTDLGANVEAKPEDLLNYSKLGKLYMKNICNISNPTIALLNIGEEENKGSKLYKDTYKILKENNDNFKGNIESRNILNHNFDIVISDGFSGNILLKTIEGVAISLNGMLKNMFVSSILSKISSLLIKNKLKDFKRKFDYSEYGGAILLGLKKPAIKIHGATDEKAVFYAIQQAKTMYNTKLYDKMIEEFKGE